MRQYDDVGGDGDGGGLSEMPRDGNDDGVVAAMALTMMMLTMVFRFVCEVYWCSWYCKTAIPEDGENCFLYQY